MKVIVIDDEKAMLLVMKKMLGKIPEIEIAGLFQNSQEAFAFVEKNHVDLAFLDINMPGESGLDLAKRMLVVSKGLDVVFSTSHREYALEAFDIFAFDYIVKPVLQSRLERTIQKAVEKRFPLVGEGPREANLFIYCFGRMDVNSGQNGAVRWMSAKSEELLAYLLLNMGRSVSRDRILEDVFRNMPLKNAETYLNTSVYQIRKALEPHGQKNIVISANDSLKLNINQVYIDFVDFENRIKSFTTIDEKNLQEAVDTEKLYTDDLFGDKAYLWAAEEVERLFSLYSGFAKKLGMGLLECNQPETALKIIKRLINRNELDEETNCLLMKLYAVQRDKNALVRHYEKCVKILERELGVKPGRNMASLFAELRMGLS